MRVMSIAEPFARALGAISRRRPSILQEDHGHAGVDGARSRTRARSSIPAWVGEAPKGKTRPIGRQGMSAADISAPARRTALSWSSQSATLAFFEVLVQCNRNMPKMPQRRRGRCFSRRVASLREGGPGIAGDAGWRGRLVRNPDGRRTGMPAAPASKGERVIAAARRSGPIRPAGEGGFDAASGSASARVR